MKNRGWIKIYRSLTEHWLWEDKPFSKGQAWIDLILSVNHTERKIAVGKEFIDVKIGELITSELKLMERWGWGKTKLRNFLKQLEDDSMIVKKTNRKQTTITIVNYSVFQNMKTETKPQTNHRQTTDKPQTNHRPYTNKNIKNEKNVRRERDNARACARENPPTFDEVKDFFSAEGLKASPDIFYHHYEASGWKNISDWKAKAREWSLKEKNPETADYASYDIGLFEKMLNAHD